MAKAKITGNGNVVINCPACKRWHVFNVDPKNGRPCWNFNGDLEKPTFSPSMLETSGCYVKGSRRMANGECGICADAEAREKYNYSCGICHSFVTDGMIRFLNDCTHSMAGQTVPLGDF